jgi:peroxiredoxin
MLADGSAGCKATDDAGLDCAGHGRSQQSYSMLVKDGRVASLNVEGQAGWKSATRPLSLAQAGG